MMIDYEKEEQASRLRGSLLEFTRYFYEYMTGSPYTVSNPISRESHHITICRVLTDVFRLKILREIINVPPGHGKSTLLSMWTAWGLAHYPDSNYLYISYSHELATKHTSFIRSIIASPMYRYLFGVEIDKSSKAKDSFKTTSGGSIKAFGSAGSITGQDAGLPNLNRFSGAIILDDIEKPNEMHSDTIRENIQRNYDETIRQRCRGMNVPIISISQRVHEADLTSFLLSGKDVDNWHSTILKAMDDSGNILYPEFFTKEAFMELSKKSRYVCAAQYQQNPLPAGGGLFEREWFVLLDEEPNFLVTFITIDTAESEKSWADATVFSFWGLYEIETMGRKIGKLGLHWIDCMEIRIEPKDLKEYFLDFYSCCSLHKTPPTMAAIEKKSTGVTLLSILKEFRGMQIRNIERNVSSGCKTQRFIDMQSVISEKSISFLRNSRHVENCINHMIKITANDTHRHDDIADTLSDAIHIALVEKSLYYSSPLEEEMKIVLESMNKDFQKRISFRKNQY